MRARRPPRDRSFVLRALLIAAVLAAACEPAPAVPPREPWESDAEIVTWSGEPDTLDPQRASFWTEAGILAMVLEPLLTYEPATLRLVPSAARSLPEISADGLVYTYRLRPGLMFSDGEPLTAGHFAAAFVRLCDPSTRGELTFVAYPIAGCEAWNALDPKRTPVAQLEEARSALGVRALDEGTIEFTLARPASHFPHVTALWVGAPVRSSDPDRDARTDPSRYIGTGPFRLVEWKAQERIVLERNVRYREPVRLRRWTKVFIADPAVARAAYEEGRLDVMPIAPSSEADREEILARPDLVRTLGTCTTYIGFNTQRPPFDDPLVRLAFAKALDREEYVRAVERTGRAAVSFIPHAQAGHAHEDRAQAFDPAEARRLLTASRYGEPYAGRLGDVTIAFTLADSPRNVARAKWAIASWSAYLGVDVKLDPVVAGWGPLVKAPQPQRLPQMYFLGWCADYPDPQDWYMTAFRRGDRTFFANGAFEALVDQAAGERDPLLREQLYQSASYVLSRSVPAAFVSWSEKWWLVRPELRGYEVSPFDWDFSTFSLARIHRPGR